MSELENPKKTTNLPGAKTRETQESAKKTRANPSQTSGETFASTPNKKQRKMVEKTAVDPQGQAIENPEGFAVETDGGQPYKGLPL
jgi:hypothetical protein